MVVRVTAPAVGHGFAASHDAKPTVFSGNFLAA
jgi:hypothetical protein